MFFTFLRPQLLWLATPLIMLLGLVAGINSASSEEAARPQPPPRVGGESSAQRPPRYGLVGRVALIDPRSQSIVVQNAKDGRLVTVFVRGKTAIKIGPSRARPRDINIGDQVVIAGKPHPGEGIDATAITVRPRADKSAPARPTPNPPAYRP